MKVDAALTCGTDVKTLRRGHPVMIPRVPTVFGHEFAGHGERGGRGRHAVPGRGPHRGGQLGALRAVPPRVARPAQPLRGSAVRQWRLRRVHRPAAAPGDGQHRRPRARRARGARGLRGAAGLCAARHRARRVQAGQTVVVLGHGPLGCLLAMVATRAPGPGDHGRPPGLEARSGARARSWECLDASVTADVVAEIRARTDGRGAEVTIDATGRPEVWEQAVDTVGARGLGGVLRRMRAGDGVRLDTRRVHYEELTLLGAFHHTPATIRRAVALLESGTLVPDALITHRMAPRRGAGGAGPDGQERGPQGADRTVMWSEASGPGSSSVES